MLYEKINSFMIFVWLWKGTFYQVAQDRGSTYETNDYRVTSRRDTIEWKQKFAALAQARTHPRNCSVLSAG